MLTSKRQVEVAFQAFGSRCPASMAHSGLMRPPSLSLQPGLLLVNFSLARPSSIGQRGTCPSCLLGHKPWNTVVLRPRYPEGGALCVTASPPRLRC